VRQFYQTYYPPSNAGLVLVGDFDAAKARERVTHFFASLPTRPAPPDPDSREPGRKAEHRETVTERGVPAPLLIIAWHAPSALDSDWLALKRAGEKGDGKEEDDSEE
jgi:predicted Zn-dependent peptidase